MEQRSCNLIMVCKGHCDFFETAATLTDAVRIFSSLDCGIPIEAYTDQVVTRLILEALYDFINTAQNPAGILRTIFSHLPLDNSPLSLAEGICGMFQALRVKNDNGFVNGFSEKLITQSDIDLSEIDTEWRKNRDVD